MSDLDDRLQIILAQFAFEFSVATNEDETPENALKADRKAAKAIKQAFADAGYIDTKPFSVTDRGELGNPKLFDGNGTRLMTGQEWYERFEKEVDAIPNGTEISTAHGADGLPTAKQLALKAAKRAAGIEE